VRVTYYDQRRPELQPERYRSLDEFLERVSAGLGGIRPVDPRDAARLSSLFPPGTSPRTRLERFAMPCLRTFAPSGISQRPLPVDTRFELERDREHSTRRA
jgi:hypothetical protein